MLITTFSEVESIDEENGIIRGVSVITVGPALGHDLFIDRTTLEQVVAASKEYENGVKVKADHGGGVFSIVGAVRDFRIEGDRVKADLYLLKSAEKRAHIIELAREIPDTFGLSVSIKGAHQKIGDKTCARCSRIRSCDIVTDPAANPDGLLEEGDEVDTPADCMDEKALKELNEWRKTTDESLSNIEKLLKPLAASVKELAEKGDGSESEAETGLTKADLDAFRGEIETKFQAINDTVAKMTPSKDPAAGTEGQENNGDGKSGDGAPKNFDEAVAAFAKEGKKPTEAIRLATEKYPELRKADLAAKGILSI